jgi:Ras-related protein Rab-8A
MLMASYGIGIDFKIKTINIDGKNVKLQIWDTAGQERFRTITQTYYKGAMGIVLAYDCTSEESFNNVRNWVRQIEVHASPNVEKILVGNKADLVDRKVIDTEQGMALAKEFGMAFFETSARSGLNVNETFFHISKAIKDKQHKNAANNQNNG